ncbi:hypothetical protein B481_0224 [Planococcus halocryophilus Or1]|nr:hypothetical protein B481_0224 [Planococcus halocryophilus Or1]
MTTSCFLLISVVNSAGYWLSFLDLFTMALTVALLITGAYFTRYMQTANRENEFKEE